MCLPLVEIIICKYIGCGLYIAELHLSKWKKTADQNKGCVSSPNFGYFETSAHLHFLFSWFSSLGSHRIISRFLELVTVAKYEPIDSMLYFDSLSLDYPCLLVTSARLYLLYLDSPL